MSAPPEKRSASAGDRGAPKIDRPERQIDETNNSPSNQFYQGQCPLALEPMVIAVLIKSELDGLVDPDVWAETKAEEDERRSVLAKVHRHWPEISRMIGGAA